MVPRKKTLAKTAEKKSVSTKEKKVPSVVERKETAVAEVAKKETAVAAVAKKETAVAEVAKKETAVAAVEKKETAVASVPKKETALAHVEKKETAVAPVQKKETALAEKKEMAADQAWRNENQKKGIWLVIAGLIIMISASLIQYGGEIAKDTLQVPMWSPWLNSVAYPIAYMIIGSQIMLYFIEFLVCSNLVISLIKQLSFRRCDFSDRPIGIADIFFCCKLPISICDILIYQCFAFVDTINRTCKCSIALCCAFLLVTFGHCH